MSSVKVLLGFLAGVTAGALLGVLFAPRKGYKTRRRVIKKGEHYADNLKEKFSTFLDDLTDKSEKVKEGVADLAGKGQTKSDKTI